MTIKTIVIENKLCLQSSNAKIKPICVDFCSPELIKKIKSGDLNKHPTIKSLGSKPKANLTIIDATAGLGRDAFIFASSVKQVIMIERNKLLFQLLEDGIKRANNNNEVSHLTKKMQLFHGNAIELLPELAKRYKPDVIYLDPMFPKPNSKSAPKKDLMLLRDLLNDNDFIDSNDLFTSAKSCCNKVIVKRHKNSEFIANAKPSHSYTGKSNRFDIYIA